MRWNLRSGCLRGAAGALLISALAGCDRDEPKVYRIPKDDAPPVEAAPTPTPPPQAVSAPPDTSAPAPSAPRLKYQLPEGWQEKPPSEMRVASFTATGPDGQSADIGVIPLPISGRDLELVNMWRSQVQLPATSDPSAVGQAEPVTIGAEQGRLFTFVSEQPMVGPDRKRVMVAMLTRGGMSWFFRVDGPDAFVASEKKKFLLFLQSVSFP